MKQLSMWLFLLFCGLLAFGNNVHAQSKTVKIRLEKTLPAAHEFIMTCEGSDFKSVFYEVQSILEEQPMVERQVYFYHLQRFSVIVKDPWTFDELRQLFADRGFVVIDKSDPVSESQH